MTAQYVIIIFATLNACTYRFDATITFAICTIVFVTWKYKNRNLILNKSDNEGNMFIASCNFVE